MDGLHDNNKVGTYYSLVPYHVSCESKHIDGPSAVCTSHKLSVSCLRAGRWLTFQDSRPCTVLGYVPDLTSTVRREQLCRCQTRTFSDEYG